MKLSDLTYRLRPFRRYGFACVLYMLVTVGWKSLRRLRHSYRLLCVIAYMDEQGEIPIRQQESMGRPPVMIQAMQDIRAGRWEEGYAALTREVMQEAIKRAKAAQTTPESPSGTTDSGRCAT